MNSKGRVIYNSHRYKGIWKSWVIFLCLLFFAFILPANQLHAQITEQSQRERSLDEPFRLLMDEQAPLNRRAIFDWGGWFRSSYWAYDEDVRRGPDQKESGFHGLRRQQLRLWGRFNLDQVHQVYARAKLDYYDWNHGSSFDHNDSDWEGVNLERLWYDFRLSRARLAYGSTPDEFDLSFRVGRQYVEFGTGLALSIPLDAILASAYYGDWQLTGLAAMSIPSTYNVDQSIPDNQKESRRYWGVQINYNGRRDHEPFVYYFAQEDQDFGMVRSDPTFGDQTFGYDSQYIGLGSRGRFFHRDLQYTCELVGEFGKSYAFAADPAEQQNIHAWALVTELRYLIPDKHFSQLAVEYLLASGDSDRRYSPTNTIGGNMSRTRDNSFVGWGYLDTGLVLAPRMSNLGMVRLDASTFPVNDMDIFRQLKVGTSLYLYHKQQSEGAISDSLSLKDSSFLGTGWDLYSDWRLTSDLAWMIAYGIFLPGDAFSSQSSRHLFFTGLTIGF